MVNRLCDVKDFDGELCDDNDLNKNLCSENDRMILWLCDVVILRMDVAIWIMAKDVESSVDKIESCWVWA